MVDDDDLSGFPLGLATSRTSAGVDQLVEAQTGNVCSQEFVAGVGHLAEVQSNKDGSCHVVLQSGWDLCEPATTTMYMESDVGNDEWTLEVDKSGLGKPPAQPEIGNGSLNLTTDVMREG